MSKKEERDDEHQFSVPCCNPDEMGGLGIPRTSLENKGKCHTCVHNNFHTLENLVFPGNHIFFGDKKRGGITFLIDTFFN